MFASEPYEQELSSALVNHILVLRNYYTDAHLTFDASGNLTSNGTPGFGPGEGRIDVKSVQLKPGRLTLTGVRVFDVLDSGSREWQVAPTATTVAVEISLPAEEDPKAAAPRLIQTVFLKKSEVAEAGCSEKEKQEFVEDMLNRVNHTTKKDTPVLPDATSLSELRQDCLPGGDRAYRVGRGVKPPHARYTPDPKYSDGARKAKLQGTSVLLAIVTPQGSTTAIGITRSLGGGLDDKMSRFGYQLDQRAAEAVSQWKFDPATFQGQPVAVAINVEVNFKLY